MLSQWTNLRKNGWLAVQLICIDSSAVIADEDHYIPSQELVFHNHYAGLVLWDALHLMGLLGKEGERVGGKKEELELRGLTIAMSIGFYI